MRHRLAALLASALSLSAVLPAVAADYYEASRQPAPIVANALVPSCEDPRVVAQVEDQFEYGAPRMIPADLAIVEFSNLMEKAYHPLGGHKEVERRYCQGTVLVSTGEHRTVYYVVEYPMGYAGISWRAEGCVLGLDKWKIYGANCESLRRF